MTTRCSKCHCKPEFVLVRHLEELAKKRNASCFGDNTGILFFCLLLCTVYVYFEIRSLEFSSDISRLVYRACRGPWRKSSRRASRVQVDNICCNFDQVFRNLSGMKSSINGTSCSEVTVRIQIFAFLLLVASASIRRLPRCWSFFSCVPFRHLFQKLLVSRCRSAYELGVASADIFQGKKTVITSRLWRIIVPFRDGELRFSLIPARSLVFSHFAQKILNKIFGQFSLSERHCVTVLTSCTSCGS